LLIVADNNYSDKDRVAAAKHLAIHYFKRPIFPVDWKINQARIIREFNNTGTDRIGREITCLFEAVGAMEEGQSQIEAVKAVRNKLSIVMLIDLLGEGWRNRPYLAEIKGLGIGEGREDLPLNFLAQEPGWNVDPGGYLKKMGDGEEPPEVFGLKKDKPIEDRRKAGVKYHHGIVDITGSQSEYWADLLGAGVRANTRTKRII